MQFPEEERRKYHADFAGYELVQQVDNADTGAGTVHADNREAATAGQDGSMAEAVKDLRNAAQVWTLLGMTCTNDGVGHDCSLPLISVMHGKGTFEEPDVADAQ